MKTRRIKSRSREARRALRILDKRYAGRHEFAQPYVAPKPPLSKDPIAASLVDALVTEFDTAFMAVETSLDLERFGPYVPDESRPYERAYQISRGLVPRHPGEAMGAWWLPRGYRSAAA
jgi:hypothetical protein